MVGQRIGFGSGDVSSSDLMKICAPSRPTMARGTMRTEPSDEGSKVKLPNAMGPALAQLSVNVGWSILLTAGLSFIGAGVRAPTPEWGSMIAIGFQNVVTGEWWPSVFPGLALAITVFGFSLVGSSIETLADPVKMRRLVRDATMRDRAAA